jgi:hypothetical protein
VSPCIDEAIVSGNEERGEGVEWSADARCASEVWECGSVGGVEERRGGGVFARSYPFISSDGTKEIGELLVLKFPPFFLLSVTLYSKDLDHSLDTVVGHLLFQGPCSCVVNGYKRVGSLV